MQEHLKKLDFSGKSSVQIQKVKLKSFLDSWHATRNISVSSGRSCAKPGLKMKAGAQGLKPQGL